ncbi:N2,N2-dimethylguanosine tRNA methyltransferase [Rhodotorula diobovata]|uniref:tRNA (guanine(26)-N(2))-dimethyltransferase n=1 Tax=Rhodotorula diobovata TaxID=5288 RepID=A0A5C5FUF8_9BASI|nr:N2,N2-dimethylguanosine tRNA methyltransferase [Rhodotorula diobovata]
MPDAVQPQETAPVQDKDVQMQVEQPAQPAEAPDHAAAPDQAADTPAVPEGFVPYTESTTSILFAAPPSSSSQAGSAPVFLNPVQQYNRDLSVVAIRTWSEARQREKRAFWEEGLRRKRERKRAGGAGADGKGKGKKRKAQDGEGVEVGAEADKAAEAAEAKRVEDKAPEPAGEPASETAAAPAPKGDEPLPPAPTYKFSLLEALSATGLRAIRYAKELPLLKFVVANDLSASAVKDIERNVAFNGLAPKGVFSLPGTEGLKEEDVKPGGGLSKADIDEARLGKVRVNEGDACVYMYQHRHEDARFDCIDLDPYGSAVPFLDAAMNAIADGGLMCVTCTDMGVLAGHNYPEKAFTHYGGVCVNAEYSHEVALRLVLNALATTAARYGRYIEPQLSLSIDFYVRLFIRVRTAPKEVKALASKTSLIYYCHTCQTPHWQSFGRVSEKVSAKTGVTNYSYHVPAGPPKGVDGERCGECGGKFHIGGPMWSAPLHNREFVKEMLEHVEDNKKDFATHERIKGMLTVALNECEAPLYFSPAKMSSLFNAVCPPLQTFGSALLNGGYTISRSHAVAGSIKTDAPRTFVHDVIREWIKTHPVKMSNVKDGSPAKVLLGKEMRHEVSLAHHPEAGKRLLDDVKVVRYQMNPQANWGPARAAVRGAPPAKKGQ